MASNMTGTHLSASARSSSRYQDVLLQGEGKIEDADEIASSPSFNLSAQSGTNNDLAINPEEPENSCTSIYMDTHYLLLRLPIVVVSIVVGVLCLVLVKTPKAIVAGVLCILVFGYALFAMVRVICSKQQPVYVFDSMGILIHDFILNMVDFVPWEDVRELKVRPEQQFAGRRAKDGPYVLVLLKNNQTYLNRGNFVQRAFRKQHCQKYGTPILLWHKGKKVASFEELCSLAGQCYLKYKTNCDADDVPEPVV